MISCAVNVIKKEFNLSNADHDYIRILFWSENVIPAFKHVEKKLENNQQDFKIIDLHFVNSECC